MTTLGACASSRQTFTTTSGSICGIVNYYPESAHIISDGLVQLRSSSTVAKPADGLDALLDSIGTNYPKIAKKAGVDGAFLFEIGVNAYGVATDVEAINPTGYEFINEIVERVVQGMVFEPAMIDDQPIATRVRLPFAVELQFAPREIDVPDLPLQTYIPEP